jgi:hypothetical protein
MSAKIVNFLCIFPEHEVSLPTGLSTLGAGGCLFFSLLKNIQLIGKYGYIYMLSKGNARIVAFLEGSLCDGNCNYWCGNLWFSLCDHA